MKQTVKCWFFPLVYAIAYGAVMLSLDGFRLYESSPYHRYQAQALLRGHLYLADSVRALQPGLVWHNGYVQHVWGLGIGLWLLPFAAIWHLFSAQPVPDRIALGAAFAILAFYSATAGLKLVRQGERAMGLLVIWGIALCPALWTLARASQLVFEETVLYSVILSLLILVSLVRVIFFASRTDYILCCALGAFAVWVRPTHALYGLGATLIATLLVGRRHHKWDVVAGVFFWSASIALLAWSNAVRFGSPTEFGHHLTVSSGSMMYLTRFGNPYGGAGFWQAMKELLALLFFADPRGANTFAEDLFPGQSPVTRWRRLDLTAFDWTYIVIMVGAIAVAIILILKNRKQKWNYPKNTFSAALLAWSGLGFVGLFYFYLHYPAIASRYLFDFAPAFVGCALLLGCVISSAWAKALCPACAAWLLFEILSAKMPVLEQHPRDSMELALPQNEGIAIKEFGGLYTSDKDPGKTQIVGNGYGWEPQSGFASDVVSLVVDDPRFIELNLSDRRGLYGDTPRKDTYNAQIDGCRLPLKESKVLDDGRIKVVFEIPPRILNRHQVEVVFLCFSEGYDSEDRSSERFLYSIRWK